LFKKKGGEKMTKKDYKRIGEAIARFYVSCKETYALNECCLSSLINYLADQLEDDNPRFDEKKFKNYVFELIMEDEK